MTDPRDWDREMADIDKAIERQQSAPPPAAPPVAPARSPVSLPPVTARPDATIVRPAGAGPGAAHAPVRRRSVAFTWLRTGLAVVLGAALSIWPYPKACGLELVFYFGAAGITVLVAIWAALASWSYRRGFAHLVALLVLVWAGVAIVAEVLPRIGYARQQLAWACASLPVRNPSASPSENAPAPSAPTTSPTQ